MRNYSNSDFGHGKIGRHILRIALPNMVAELVHVMYSLVDRMYIGHIAGLGTMALSGIGIAFPLITLVSAFASISGTGGAPLCSIARGRQNEKEAQEILDNAFSLTLVLSFVVAVSLFAFRKPLLLLMGADRATLPYADQYFSIYCAGIVFSFISLGLNPFINLQGFSGVGMCTVLFGALANIILDPIFIFVFHLGIRGAAVATVISEALSAGWVLHFLCGEKTLLKISRFHLHRGHIRSIVSLGITGFVFKMTNSLTQAVVNVVIRNFGGDLSVYYIGSMSVINSLREVCSQPVDSIAQGAKPVLGYNYGAAEYSRAKKTILFSLIATLAYNTLVWAVLVFFTEPVIRIFTNDPEFISVCIPCVRIYFGAFFMMSFQNVGQHTFTGLNKPKYALFFSMFRKIILLLPLTLLLPRTFLGISGVFCAEMISQIVGASACFLTMLAVVWRELSLREKNLI